MLFPSPITPYAGAPSHSPIAIALTFLPFILHSAFGVFLWMFADALAIYMAPATTTQQSIEITPKILAIVFIVLGLWLTADTFPKILGVLVGYYYSSLYNDYSAPRTLGEFVAYCIQFCIGLWFLFGARGFVRWIRSIHPYLWLRDLGRDPIPAEESPAE
jgi:hypothetical protein